MTPDLRRPCMSNDPMCTGLSPCDRCEELHWSRVVVESLAASGVDRDQAERFMRSYRALSSELEASVFLATGMTLAAVDPSTSPAAAPSALPEETPAEAAEQDRQANAAIELVKDEPIVVDADFVETPLTADELGAMSEAPQELEESAEDGPSVLSSKKARAFARKARKNKAARATQKEKDEHGEGQDRSEDREQQVEG